MNIIYEYEGLFCIVYFLIWVFAHILFEFRIALYYVLGLKEMSLNVTWKVLVIFCDNIIQFSKDFVTYTGWEH